MSQWTYNTQERVSYKDNNLFLEITTRH